jgi:hypothetical protein
MDGLLTEIRIAARRLTRSPFFSIFVILTLALGISDHGITDSPESSLQRPADGRVDPGGCAGRDSHRGPDCKLYPRLQGFADRSFRGVAERMMERTGSAAPGVRFRTPPFRRRTDTTPACEKPLASGLARNVLCISTGS